MLRDGGSTHKHQQHYQQDVRSDHGWAVIRRMIGMASPSVFVASHLFIFLTFNLIFLVCFYTLVDVGIGSGIKYRMIVGNCLSLFSSDIFLFV